MAESHLASLQYLYGEIVALPYALSPHALTSLQPLTTATNVCYHAYMFA